MLTEMLTETKNPLRHNGFNNFELGFDSPRLHHSITAQN